MPKIRKIILISDFISTYERGLLRGIAKYSRLHGPWLFYKMPMVYLDPAWKGQKAEMARLQVWGADGIFTQSLRAVRDMARMGMPVITTDDSEMVENVPCIVSDYEATGKMAAEYLINRGFRHFAYCGVDAMHWSEERSKSFCKHISQAGCDVTVYEQPKTKALRLWENEQLLLARWLKSLPKPTAIMACSDNRSQEVCEACKIAELHVPEEVAVIGVDNDEVFCELSNPPLSSVAFNTEKAGYDAAELLNKLMSGQIAEDIRIVVHPVHIATRHSTDILAIGDAEVAKAVRFIRDHHNKSIQVADVVNAVTISRRNLERRFRNALNRSVHEEIRRVHVGQVARMLVETTLSVTRIVSSLGYPDIDNIAKYFKRETGLRPLAYRKQYGEK